MTGPGVAVGSGWGRALASYYSVDLLGLLGFFLLTPGLIALYGQGQYGVLALTQALVGYLGVLDLGVKPALARMVATAWAVGDEARTRSLINSAGAFFAGVAVVALIVAALMATLLPLEGDAWAADAVLSVRTFILLRGLQFALALYFSAFESANYGMDRVVRMNLIRALAVLGDITASAVALLLELPLYTIAIVGIVVTIVTGLLHLVTVRERLPHLHPSLRGVRRAHLSELVRFGAFFVIDGAVVVLVFKTDELVLTAAISISAVAVYSALNRASQAILAATGRIPAASYPRLNAFVARGEGAAARALYLSSLERTLGAAMAAAVPFVFFGHELAEQWLNVPIPLGLVTVFALVPIFHAPITASSKYLAAAGVLRRVTVMSVVEGVTNLILSLVLVDSLGSFGVALATLCSKVATTAWFNPAVACAHLGMSAWTVLPRAFARGLLVAGPALGLATGLWIAVPSPTATQRLAIALSVLAASIGGIIVRWRRHAPQASSR